jgi:hypothetical protein
LQVEVPLVQAGESNAVWGTRYSIFAFASVRLVQVVVELLSGVPVPVELLAWSDLDEVDENFS